MWAVSAGTIAWSSAKLRQEADDRQVPLMGVLGAFLFAAQMINFSVPGTGSSGHLGGGLLLAILLGPHAAFLTIASVLVVQALFFADGGLLALGCNIVNMGFFPAFVVYPLVYRKLIGAQPSRVRLSAVTILCAVLGLQLGPFAVVLETVASGISALPFKTFLLLMQPIHLAIGVVEGMVTVAILGFLREARPDILRQEPQSRPFRLQPARYLLFGFLVAAVITGGMVSAFASKNPDGLEWAIAKVTGSNELPAPDSGLHRALSRLQERTALLPGYDFRNNAGTGAPPVATVGKGGVALQAGTSVSGILGASVTLLLVFLSGLLLKKRHLRKAYGAN